MKPVLAWIKSNLLIVIAGVLVVGGLPAMLYFSARWNAQVRKDAESTLSSQMRDIDSIKVTYEIPSVFPGEQPVRIDATPNQATTDAVAGLLRQIQQQSEEVKQAAIERNRAGRQPLITGPDPEDNLFPQPVNESARTRLRATMVDRWPAAHVELLRSHRAGMPPDPQAVLDDLQRHEAQEIERLTADREEKQLTPTERGELDDALARRRLAYYRRAADEISVYAGDDVFADVVPWPEGDLPDMGTLWEWQFLYWVHEDVLRAVARANSIGTDGAPDERVWMPVYAAPVKRLERISVEPWTFTGSMGAEAPAGELDDSSEYQPDYSRSFTGRVSWPYATNSFFDIRYVDMECVVASRGIPALLEAIAQTNFMTVIDMDLEAMDPLPELEAGFDFGADHVVRARMRIETAWLRHWMLPLMPPGVRQAMGIPPAPEPAVETQDAG